MNPSVPTKLADRGSFQAVGLVMDAASFLKELARTLWGGAHESASGVFPEYFQIDYEINPWMRRTRCSSRSPSQWQTLMHVLQQDVGGASNACRRLGTAGLGVYGECRRVVAVAAPCESVPDRYPERQREEMYFEQWFPCAGFDVLTLTRPVTSKGRRSLGISGYGSAGIASEQISVPFPIERTFRRELFRSNSSTAGSTISIPAFVRSPAGAVLFPRGLRCLRLATIMENGSLRNADCRGGGSDSVCLQCRECRQSIVIPAGCPRTRCGPSRPWLSLRMPELDENLVGRRCQMCSCDAPTALIDSRFRAKQERQVQPDRCRGELNREQHPADNRIRSGGEE